MPWNDNSNGNSGGPWGQSPKGGGRGGGNQPPDLEDLLRRSQDRFKRALPSGGLGGPVLLVGLGLLLVAWAWTGVYIVEPEEEGLVLRFGKYVESDPPGLNFHWPYPIESHQKVAVLKNNQINVGFNDRGRDVPQESLMLTGDENIVNIHFSVFWQIREAVQLEDGSGVQSGAADYKFNIQNPDEAVKAVSESSMREVVGRNDLQSIITEGRQVVESETQTLVQETLDSYGAGVLITQVQLQKADPPDEVIEAFRDVVAARQDQDRVINESRAYANKIVPEARGAAEQVIQQAEAYRAQTVVEANGDAARFNAIYTEYSRASDVTRQRMFLETMERVLKGKNKVLIDNNAGTGVVPYLPLPEIQRRAEQGASQ